ncbi:MAG: carbohydrate kinase family protein [Bryobacteraceae bacterium]|nr:carbohydrate kinase family protein [Bryobacteraceae bacterium]
MIDILCVSDMCVDLVLRGDVRPRFNQVEQLIDDYALELGGSANIFACQFANLGGSAGVAGWIGDDVFGRFALQRLQSAGVNVDRVGVHPRLKTGIGVALAEPGDRAILTYLGTIDATQPEELTSGLLDACRHWHLASYFLLNSLRGAWADWLARCKRAGLTTSLDTNWDPEGRWHGVTDLLGQIDVFLPNETEALAIAGESNVLKAGERLAAMGPVVVVKRGRDGAMAFQNGRRWEIAPDSGEALAIVDAIGAGDNFDAGFLRGWLLRRSIEECLALGARCAVASLQGAGGIEGQVVEPAD